MKFFVSLLIFLFVTFEGVCQPHINYSQNGDSVIYQLYPETADSIKQQYDELFNLTNQNINGKSYQLYFNPNISRPFLENEFGKGIIYWQGKRHDFPSIAYDSYQDEIILNVAGYKLIVYNKNRIDSVLLYYPNQTYHLSNVRFSTSINQQHNGFYEVYKFNTFELYIKYYSELTNTKDLGVYTHSSAWHILLDDDLYEINKRKQLFQLFIENRNQIKKKINSIASPYKKFNREELFELMDYIESL